MTSRTKRIFALIIGIDEYLDPKIRRLRGAVADADSFAEYLTTRLDVPTERIRNLRNGQATRNAIKHELISLKINDKIKKDDPILIFFAGHGNDAPAPPEWSNWGSNVQSLTPHDYGQRDYEGGIVQGLPDRTLGTILKELANAKGNNITVILDCCHSGSGTRSIDPSVRCAPTAAHLIPADLDSDVIPITRGVTELPKFRHQGLQSHVLLAACLPEELAHELQTQGRGAFTYALLNALYLLDSVDTTYADLMRRLTHLPRQNPQCEGNSNRMLFSNIVRSMKGCYIAKLEKDKLVIEAGIINGVTSATVFDLWLKIDDVFGTPLTTLPEKGLCKPFPLRTEVKSPSLKHHNVPGTNFIVKPRNTEKPTLAVHVEDNAKLIFRSLCEHPNALATFVLEEKPKGLADVGLSAHRESISFHLLASEESRFHCPPRQIGIENVWDYLSHAAFYYQRLRQVNGATQKILPGSKPANPPKTFISMFDIRVYQLEEDSYGNYHPRGDPLNTREGVHLMLEDGQGDGEEVYGFEIVNNSSFDVYPYLFYFNSYELSIQSLYEPVVLAQRPTPPLKKGQALTIGWGPGGVEPPGFSVGDDDTDVENGFLKLYITQKPVELGFLAQGSIGEAHRGMKTLSREPMGQLWGSVKIPFVLQRKRNAASEEAPFLCLLGTKNAKISFMKTISPLYRAKSTTSVGPSIEHHDFTLEDGSRLTLIDLPALDTRDLHKSGKVCHDILDYFRE
ncbi:hypothetical protein CC2G_002392 [Coprinopsis cinerea AmutBmut pab1-1]|nr:hypothetical protein CC2G_002392 [Coprinopsis cinerea AmutBmut pab1-1]